MHNHQIRRKSITVIDHEPLKTEPLNKNHRPEKGEKVVFGKRNSTNYKPAVTQDFFSSPPNKNFKAERFEDEMDLNAGIGSFTGVFSVLPLRSLAAVLAIAVGLPMALIAYSEKRPANNIDPMTTASISHIEGLEITDVSLTRVLRQQSSVATVFGRVSNVAGTARPLKPLVISLYDKDGTLVQSWQHRIGKNKIEANQNYRFMTSAIDYSGDGRTVRVSIAKD